MSGVQNASCLDSNSGGSLNSAFYHLSTGCHHFTKRQLSMCDCDCLLKAEVEGGSFSVTDNRNICGGSK